MAIDAFTDTEIGKEIDAGRIWRARELLHRKVRKTAGYDPELFAAYGDVLSMMHDDLLAGKYYFLAGSRGEEHKWKIDLFLKRYSKGRLRHLTSQFPSSAQYDRIDEFPIEQVRSDLHDLELVEPTIRQAQGRSKSNETWLDRLALPVVLLVLLSIPIGMIAIFRGLWALVRFLFS